MNRSDFKALTVIRQREGILLLKNKQYSGAYYLAGYAVECALKACISKETRLYDFPDMQRTKDSWSHSLTQLLRTAGLKADLETETKADPEFAANWSVVKDWSEQSRYGKTDQKKAKALIRAISDESHGVLRWLKRYW